MSETKDAGRELEWDEEIEAGSDFTLLPEGTYNFKVESFERGRSKGEKDIPPCKMAILKIKLYNDEQSTLVTEYLTLWSTLKWKVSEFFESIGAPMVDDKVKMDWNMVPGATGKCSVIIHKYKDNEYNKIKKFLPPERKKFTAGQF